MLTENELKDILPPAMQKSVSCELVKGINDILSDPDTMEIFKDNMISFNSVVSQGKFKIEQYIKGVLYVSYKIMGDTNKAAYIKVFPEKYKRFINNNMCASDIASYVAAYNRSKLITLIYEVALVPVHLLNAAKFQEAINVQANLMNNAKSEMVRCNAATCLITQLKPPEAKKIELDLSYKEDESIKALRDSTSRLAEEARQLIVSGKLNAADVAEQVIMIEGVNEEE